MKYVTLASEAAYHIVCFSESLQHKTVADSLKAHGEPYSAGFCEIRNGKVKTYGMSDSLNLAPKAGDELDLEAVLLARKRP